MAAFLNVKSMLRFGFEEHQGFVGFIFFNGSHIQLTDDAYNLFDLLFL